MTMRQSDEANSAYSITTLLGLAHVPAYTYALIALQHHACLHAHQTDVCCSQYASQAVVCCSHHA